MPLLQSAVVAWALWWTERGGAGALARCQRARLARIVRFARTHSRFYRERYDGLPSDGVAIRRLPPVTKAELMAAFDAWVTDPAVTAAGVSDFVADPGLVGVPYLGRYAVWTTSGTTGQPGMFLHDEHAIAVYYALGYVRAWLAWTTPLDAVGIIQRGLRTAVVIATGGHFASTAAFERHWRNRPWGSRQVRAFSVLMPLADLVRALNDFQPALLFCYPTLLALLAEEQKVGRLQIDPVLITTGAEWLAPAVRPQMQAVFGCPVRDMYGATECLTIAFDCAHRWLHVNADWVILEPVDQNFEPVPAGQTSHTVLLTNLANHIQPIIRYDLGDRVTVRPDPCPCGSSLPAIRVEGRQDEILYLRAVDGRTVPLLPMAIATLVETTRGVRRFQVLQTAPDTLVIRLEAAIGADDRQVWQALAARLRAYLETQGLPSVVVERADAPPQRDPLSRKFRQVWSVL